MTLHIDPKKVIRGFEDAGNEAGVGVSPGVGGA
jgi:hypothetical protein